MIDRIKDFIKVALMIGICMVIIIFIYQLENRTIQSNYDITTTSDTINSIPEFMEKPAKEGLNEALIYYNIQHSNIVHAQAILETGQSMLEGCGKYNNLFGLYNSKRGEYYRFNHWSESVIAYREWIQRRYIPPEDYYKFLSRIRYASDPEYILKLKQIVNNKDDKRRYIEGDTLS